MEPSKRHSFISLLFILKYGKEAYKNAFHVCRKIIFLLLTNKITAFLRCRCHSRIRFLNSLVLDMANENQAEGCPTHPS